MSSTDINRLYDIAVAGATDDSGRITDPAVYKKARETYLDPYVSEPAVLKKKLESVNNERQLTDSIEKSFNSSKTLERTLKDNLLTNIYGFTNDPERLVTLQNEEYQDFLSEVSKNIESARLDGDQNAVNTWMGLAEKYSQEAQNVHEGALQLSTGLTGDALNQFGFFIETNPSTGQIKNITFQDRTKISGDDYMQVDSSLKRSDGSFIESPVFVNAVQVIGEDGTGESFYAKVGNETFEGDASESLVKQGTGMIAKAKAMFTSETRENQKSIDLSQTVHQNYPVTPSGTIVKDSFGNFYLNSEEGYKKADSPEVLRDFLSTPQTPLTVQDIEGKATLVPFESSRFLNAVTQSDERKIKASDVQGFDLNPNATQATSTLPSVDQDVSASVSTAPLQQPPLASRKQVGIQRTNNRESTGGRFSVPDIIATGAQFVGSPATSLANLAGRNIAERFKS